MPRFAAVYALYQREEEEARKEVGRRERRRAELEAERAAQAAERLAAAAAATPALHEQYLAYWQGVEQRLAGLAGEIAAAEQAVAEARAQLIAAHRRTAAIAKLRELDAERERREGERRDQRRTDDFAARQRLMLAAAAPQPEPR